MHTKTKKITALWIGIVFLSTILGACRQAEPELDINAQRTAFAQTAVVQASLTAAAQPTPTETPVPSPTFTPTDLPTATPILSPTPAEPTEQPPDVGVNRAQIIAQDPENNTTFEPGEEFVVTWTLENKGTTTWSIRYYIEFAFGDQMHVQDKEFIWLPVPPETSLPISVSFIAPREAGSKVSNWKLFDADGVAFYDFSITITIAE